MYKKNSCFIILVYTRKKPKKINFQNNICSITFQQLCKWNVATKKNWKIEKWSILLLDFEESSEHNKVH